MRARSILVALMLSQPGCSLLFSPSDSSDPYAIVYDFENGLQDWTLDGAGCERVVDPDLSAPSNIVVCCEGGSGISPNSAMSLIVPATREIEVSFRLWLETETTAFSVLGAADDDGNLDNPMVANMDQMPSTGLSADQTSFKVAVFSDDAEGSMNVRDSPINTWLDMRFSVSTAECPEVSVSVTHNNIPNTVTKATEDAVEPLFTRVILGVFRQQHDETNRRCFDDIRIRPRHICSSP